ncbi:MAG: hypothetical protein ONB44_06325 [candidate division KSB1 bacterium]|nr:hypothetical protein [candidate division KSB1 bacterium]MDZ7301739.1 hypothetical protein [candidate division KSB1 bacterium]MDZ7311482.1 hypothetical protein [candidate division KSB1 bacterium]
MLFRLKRRHWYSLGLVLGLAAWSCLNPFAPALDRGMPGAEMITDQSTPEKALTNFKYAYIFKDSLLYADLLDSAFVFQYFDPNQGASGIFVSWTREVDLKTTGKLLRIFDSINLEWLNTIFTSTDVVNNDTLATISKSFQLDLASAGYHFSVSGFAIFKFRRSRSDDKWRIVLWVDKSDL